MRLADKLKHLRLVEGLVRGKDRALTQAEAVRLMEESLGKTISQAYLSQLESGAREHMTMTTRNLLAQFFKVHPGYLVSDPEDYQEELRTGPLLGPAGAAGAPAASTAREPPSAGKDEPLTGPGDDDALRGWLKSAAQHPELGAGVQAALLKLAEAEDPATYLCLLRRLTELPEVAKDLLDVLKE
ncbi:MAG TPA: transcriptional regulator [Bacillota bacterium]|jgi:transcriptional regulator with XRE-family HTH domain